jgi:hypothetical protein
VEAESDDGGTRHKTNPSRVVDKAAFCSRVSVLKAFNAVVRAGFSTSGSSEKKVGGKSYKRTAGVKSTYLAWLQHPLPSKCSP